MSALDEPVLWTRQLTDSEKWAWYAALSDLQDEGFIMFARPDFGSIVFLEIADGSYDAPCFS